MIKSALAKLRKGLQKTRDDFVGKLQTLLGGKAKLDPDTLDQIEELLIKADMGVAASLRITRNLERRVKETGGETTMDGILSVIRDDLKEILKTAKPKVHPQRWSDIADDRAGATKGGKAARAGKGDKLGKQKGKKGRRDRAEQAAATAEPIHDTTDLATAPPAPKGPDVIFVVGVNGTGKTTSIAKLAHYHKEKGRNVLVVAADTFRAAAIEQLAVWADRVGVPCIKQAQGSDPAAVVHDALSAAAARGHDLVIVDTAGRLHTKINLMAELGKIERVIERKTGRPPQTLLVVDANTGQNGLAQARMFAETIPVDGLILAKLDGTAKGGIVVAIAEEIGLPVTFVGTGETKEDLQEFDVEMFVEALFEMEAVEE